MFYFRNTPHKLDEKNANFILFLIGNNQMKTVFAILTFPPWLIAFL